MLKNSASIAPDLFGSTLDILDTSAKILWRPSRHHMQVLGVLLGGLHAHNSAIVGRKLLKFLY